MLLPSFVMLAALRPELRVATMIVFVLIAIPTPYWLIMNASTENIGRATIIDRVQEDWPAWSAILYHGAKPIPVLLFWGYLIWEQANEGLSFDWLRSQLEAVVSFSARSSSRRGAERLP
jgi:hypothetical protein